MKEFKIGLVLFFLSFVIKAHSQHFETWTLWENAMFEDVYLEEYYAYVSLLVMDDDLEKLDGREITITGYYIPVLEEGVIVLSKYPYANCFFCGGAGLESIVDIKTKKPIENNFTTDQLLTFKGTLRLNADDFIDLAFILEDAVMIDD